MVLHYVLAALLFSGSVVNAQSNTPTLLPTPTITTKSARTRTIETSSITVSAFWTHTTRTAMMGSMGAFTYLDGVVSTRSLVTYRGIKTGVTPIAKPISTSRDPYVFSNVATITEYYAADAVVESDLVVTQDYYQPATLTASWSTVTSTNVAMYMPVSMVAPPNCPTPFTISTTVPVIIPTEVRDQITPTSTIREPSSNVVGGSVIFYETWYLRESVAPFTATSEHDYLMYVASCSAPPAPPTGYGYDLYDADGKRRCRHYCGYSNLKIWAIVIAIVLPSLFLLGILESWLWFRRLMMGKTAIRFGTCFWVLLSLWMLCFTRIQDARSAEDQVLLRERYKAMSTSAALKAWLKWGLRRSYPVPLLGQYSLLTVGIVPAGEPIHPAMDQVPPPEYYQSQPGAMQPPGQPGVTYPYDPQQGYAPQAAGYFGGDVQKERSATTSAPIPMPPPAASIYPSVGMEDAPSYKSTQSLYTPPTVAQSDAHASQAPQDLSSHLQQQNHAPAPSANAREAPTQPPSSATQARVNDPNERS